MGGVGGWVISLGDFIFSFFYFPLSLSLPLTELPRLTGGGSWHVTQVDALIC